LQSNDSATSFLIRSHGAVLILGPGIRTIPVCGILHHLQNQHPCVALCITLSQLASTCKFQVLYLASSCDNATESHSLHSWIFIIPHRLPHELPAHGACIWSDAPIYIQRMRGNSLWLSPDHLSLVPGTRLSPTTIAHERAEFLHAYHTCHKEPVGSSVTPRLRLSTRVPHPIHQPPSPTTSSSPLSAVVVPSAHHLASLR
jgi:hypothetical protein